MTFTMHQINDLRSRDLGPWYQIMLQAEKVEFLDRDNRPEATEVVDICLSVLTKKKHSPDHDSLDRFLDAATVWGDYSDYVRSSDLLHAYREWCEERGYAPEYSSRTLKAAVLEKSEHAVFRRCNGGSVFRNLTLV